MTLPADTADAPRPRSPGHLFVVFNRLALRGFGGVLPWAQRALVEEERWLDEREYVALLSLAQVLPGPNIVNLALMLGERFFGLRGALAALAGMLAAPLAIVTTLALLYSEFAHLPAVRSALQGMGAVSAGLVLAMATKLLPTLRRRRAAWIFAAAAFALVGLLRWPLPWVMLGLGAASVAWSRFGARS